MFELRRCKNWAHMGWLRYHITSAGQEKCNQAQDDHTPKLDRPMVYDPRDEDLAKKKAETERLLQERKISEPTSNTEQQIQLNGERQLEVLSSDQLKILNALLTKGVLKLNDRVRRNEDLESPYHLPAVLDYLEFSSLSKVSAGAEALFESLGYELELDNPITAYRGIGVEDKPTDDHLDFWDMRAYLKRTKTSLNKILDDPGIAFATHDKSAAMTFDGTMNPLFQPKWQIIFKLNITRGICFPPAKHRSDRLFRKLAPHYYLHKGMSQVVIPPSSWKLGPIVGNSNQSIPEIELEQLSSARTH